MLFLIMYILITIMILIYLFSDNRAFFEKKLDKNNDISSLCFDMGKFLIVVGTSMMWPVIILIPIMYIMRFFIPRFLEVKFFDAMQRVLEYLINEFSKPKYMVKIFNRTIGVFSVLENNSEDISFTRFVNDISIVRSKIKSAKRLHTYISNRKETDNDIIHYVDLDCNVDMVFYDNNWYRISTNNILSIVNSIRHRLMDLGISEDMLSNIKIRIDLFDSENSSPNMAFYFVYKMRIHLISNAETLTMIRFLLL